MTTTATQFTTEQLDTLRAEYANIQRIDPSGAAYRKLIQFLDTLPQSHLKQLAAARINFVSRLAQNRVKPSPAQLRAAFDRLAHVA